MYLSNPDYIDTIRPIEMIMGNLAGIGNKALIPNKVAKAKLIMEKFDLLKDASNERQKASTKGAFSKLNRINPYYELKKGEEYNQTPLNIAVLRDTPIKDKNGNESNVWDALEAEYNSKHKAWELTLKDEFNTEENHKNWIEAKGEDYYAFKNRTTAVITDTHGDFDPRSGMMAKSYQGGQALLMFKTWLPRQFFVRFGIEQQRLATQQANFKGRYRSHTPLSAAIQTSILGLWTLGPIGVPLGLGVGYMVGHLTGVKSGVNILTEMLTINKILTRKMLGFPVNQISRLVSGKNLINTTHNYYDTLSGKDFTKEDYDRYITNAQEMAIMLMYIGLLLLSKSLFWDDDDKTEEGKRKRKMHNLFANRFINLAGQITSYMNLYEAGKDLLNPAPLRTGAQIQKTLMSFNNFLHGEDTITSGVHSGESALGNNLKKTLVPGLLYKDAFGWETQMQQQFQTTPFDKYFHGEEYKYKKELKSEKAVEKKELEDEGLNDKEIKHRLKHDFPSKRKHQTYKSLFERHKQRQEQEKDSAKE